MTETNGSAGLPPATSIADLPAPGSRSAEQIRADIVAQRQHLGASVDQLRGRVNELTDVRLQAERHRTELIIAAVAIGALVGAAILLRRR